MHSNKRDNDRRGYGSFRITGHEAVRIDGDEVAVIRATLDTDAPALGGHHQLLLFGEQAIEAQAFSRSSGQPLEAAIYGWLRTTWVDGKSEAVLIVNRVTFFLPLRERKRAIELIKHVGRDGYSKREGARLPHAIWPIPIPAD
jgi:hypothetical protein